MDEEPFKVVNEKDYLLPPNEAPNISSSYNPRPENKVSCLKNKNKIKFSFRSFQTTLLMIKSML